MDPCQHNCAIREEHDIPELYSYSSWMAFAKRAANTAALSSKRGMVNCFKGATHDLAAMNFTSYLSSCALYRMYAHAPKVPIAHWYRLLTGFLGRTRG